MIALIGMIMPVLIRLIGMFIDSQVAAGKLKEEDRKNFLDWVAAYNKSAADQSKLRQSAKDQREQLGG